MRLWGSSAGAACRSAVALRCPTAAAAAADWRPAAAQPVGTAGRGRGGGERAGRVGGRGRGRARSGERWEHPPALCRASSAGRPEDKPG